MTLFIASLILSPCAPVCWWVARHELQRVELGECSEHGKGWLGLAMTGGVFITCLMLSAFLIILGR